MEIGRILSVRGKVQRNSITNGQLLPCTNGTILSPNNRIRTYSASYTQVLLNNGLIIILNPDSRLIIFTVKNNDNESPSKIKLEYGKALFSSRPRYRGISAFLSTPTSDVEITTGDFGIIACTSATRIFIAKGYLIVKSVLSSLMVPVRLEKNETAIIQNTGSILKKTSGTHMTIQSWLNTFLINNEKTNVIINSRPNKFIDLILRETN